MKILAIHADYITFKSTKQAVKIADQVDKKEKTVKECLVVFTAVEKEDESDVKEISKRLTTEVVHIAEQIKAKNIVLYPYAHLSSELASPAKAIEVLKESEHQLKKKFSSVTRAPFGWYKSFEIRSKGHPLSELSKKITVETVKQEKKDESFFLEPAKISHKEQLHLSASFIIGKAVEEVFHEAVIGMNGLYHDQGFVDIAGVTLKSGHLERIEKKAKEIIKRNLPFKNGSPKDVKNKFQKEVLKDLGKDAKIVMLEDTVLIPFFKDAYVKSTKEVGAIKMLNLASAYWKNNASNAQLSRIYMAGFKDLKEQEKYMKRVEEAEKNSHINIGKELQLFFSHDVSPGGPFFLPKGTIVLTELENLFKDIYRKQGYQEVRTPTIFNNKLWKSSGHWDHFKDDMFFIKDEDMAMKPMNCPSHTIIYAQSLHSYRELPLRFADFGILHRNELSGTLHGLTRVRKLSQDDGHIFCSADQIESEVQKLIQLVHDVYGLFGLDKTVGIELSTRPSKAMGEKKLWDQAEKALQSALKKSKSKFKINPGDGAFYGPKIDFHVKDSLGRSWQLGTIQLDFQMPERFNLTYEGKDGKKYRPVMIHRAILGSLERFLGILLEETKGNLPLWLSPVQVKVLTITDRNVKFGQKVVDQLQEEGIRAEIDDDSETMGKKVREAQVMKIPYILTVGDKEMKKKTVAVRERSGKVTFDVPVQKFVDQVVKEVKKKVFKQ